MDFSFDRQSISWQVKCYHDVLFTPRVFPVRVPDPGHKYRESQVQICIRTNKLRDEEDHQHRSQSESNYEGPEETSFHFIR